MSTPVLIDPNSGNVVLNIKTGPAPATYIASSLDGPNGALPQFKQNLVSITGEAALNSADSAKSLVSYTYRTMKDEQAKLEGQLTTAKLRRNQAEIDRLTKLIAGVRAAKQKAKGSNWNAVETQKKIACGWTKGWMTGRLSPPSKPGPGCASTNFLGGTRKLRKRARRSNTSKH